LALLRGIPFWGEALTVEVKAGVMVIFISDPQTSLAQPDRERGAGNIIEKDDCFLITAIAVEFR
jgi:hypothetical protein